MSATFRSLSTEPINSDNSALGDWYVGVADTPIEQLEIRDLCRALRQELFLEHLVPIAAAHVRLDANAGDLFDGELASVLARLARPFWAKNEDILVLVKEILGNAIPSVDEDVRSELASFVEMAGERATSTTERKER